MERWSKDGTSITRLDDPGFELVLPQDDAATDVLRRSPWLHPCFVTDDWDLRVGSSALLVETADVTALVDPWLAFDDPERFDRRLGALHDAGRTTGDIDVVVNTHVDGIGANVVPGTTEPAFPNATYLVPDAEVDAVADGRREGAEALGSLIDRGRAQRVDAPFDVADGLALEDLPGHNAGHVGVLVGSPPWAVIVGHLFLHPAQVANPDIADLDERPDVVRATRRALLERCVQDDLLLVGPLFAAPGAGHVARDGESYRLVDAP
jgi:hypothetical protein